MPPSPSIIHTGNKTGGGKKRKIAMNFEKRDVFKDSQNKSLPTKILVDVLTKIGNEVSKKSVAEEWKSHFCKRDIYRAD